MVEVIPGSPAELSGLQAGDVVLRAQDRAVSSAESLQKLLFAEAIGEPFPLTVLRDGKALQLTAVPSEMSQPA